jgi:cytochrome P450
MHPMSISGSTTSWLALATAILLTLIRFLWKRSTDARTLPPGPKGLPLIGNLHQVPKKRQFEDLYRLSKDYGPIMHLNMAGQPMVVLSSQRAARDLLTLRGARYSDRPRMVMCGELATKGMHILFRPYDAAYRLHQRMEAPLLNSGAARRYTPLQDLESSQLLFDILKESDTVGQKGLDAYRHIERAMASFIYSLAYGYRIKTGREEPFEDAKRVQAQFREAGIVGAYIVDILPVLNYLPALLAPWKKKAEDLYRLEENLHLGNLKRGLENPGWNFTKHYFSDSPEARGMPRVEIAFDLGILADAALDTSAITMGWFVVAWATSDGKWAAEAQQILDRVVGRGRMPQFEDRDRLTYIDAIGRLLSACLTRKGYILSIDALCSQRNLTLATGGGWGRAALHQDRRYIPWIQDPGRLDRHSEPLCHRPGRISIWR